MTPDLSCPEWVSDATWQRFWGFVDMSSVVGCWPWTGAFNTPGSPYKNKRGGSNTRRPVFKLAVGTVVYAHRLACAFKDGVPLWERAEVGACHLVDCGNPACCRPSHVYWGTAQQNRADRYRGGDRGAVASAP